jgi:thioredoxin 1
MLVACLCADWCGACREYKPLFDALAAKFPQIQFLWVDVEDQADLIDPIEVENFPTILIANAASPFFFGSVLPHIETLERLIQDKLIHGKPLPVAQDDIYKLAKTLIAK